MPPVVPVWIRLSITCLFILSLYINLKHKWAKDLVTMWIYFPLSWKMACIRYESTVGFHFEASCIAFVYIVKWTKNKRLETIWIFSYFKENQWKRHGFKSYDSQEERWSAERFNLTLWLDRKKKGIWTWNTPGIKITWIISDFFFFWPPWTDLQISTIYNQG